MDKNLARKIADGLTWARIWSVIPITIVAWYDLRGWVLGLYIAAALTDLLDGRFARIAAPPASDVDFDGNADVIFSIMTLAWIWMLVPGFFETYWLPWIPILAVNEIYMTVVRVRNPAFRIRHFQFGRFGMMLFCFLLPVLLVFGDVPLFVHTVFFVGTLGKLQVTRSILFGTKSPVTDKAEA
jgi:hypothetical protein